MLQLNQFTRGQLLGFYDSVREVYSCYQKMELQLDMSRGKPSPEQLALSYDMLSLPNGTDFRVDGIDASNYGGFSGLPGCRALFSEILGVPAKNIFIGGNSSLTMMYDVIAKAYTHGLLHSPKPWSKEERIKFLCPAPGYDRHFAICESFQMEMLPVEMLPDGPNMDQVESFVKDPLVKGIWCVPRFSNPDGVIYSEAVVRRLANLKAVASDFTVLWDNAYVVHAIQPGAANVPEILSCCESAGNSDRIIEFASTSKITLAGSGVACFATSDANMDYFKKVMAPQTISYDKMNQLRHVQFLQNRENTLLHMAKHAAILKPKFDAVIEGLTAGLDGLGIARFVYPAGGYFISLYAMEGTAKRIHTLMKEAGILMTAAGATYPYGNDPHDSNLRIAPSFVSVEELRQATAVLCACVKMAAAEKLLASKQTE